MAQDKPLTSEEYAAKKGGCCPFCGSGAIEGAFIEIEANWAFQRVSCNECDKEWTDTYILTGYEP